MIITIIYKNREVELQIAIKRKSQRILEITNNQKLYIQEKLN